MKKKYAGRVNYFIEVKIYKRILNIFCRKKKT